MKNSIYTAIIASVIIIPITTGAMEEGNRPSKKSKQERLDLEPAKIGANSPELKLLALYSNTLKDMIADLGELKEDLALSFSQEALNDLIKVLHSATTLTDQTDAVHILQKEITLANKTPNLIRLISLIKLIDFLDVEVNDESLANFVINGIARLFSQYDTFSRLNRDQTQLPSFIKLVEGLPKKQRAYLRKKLLSIYDAQSISESLETHFFDNADSEKAYEYEDSALSNNGKYFALLFTDESESNLQIGLFETDKGKLIKIIPADMRHSRNLIRFTADDKFIVVEQFGDLIDPNSSKLNFYDYLSKEPARKPIFVGLRNAISPDSKVIASTKSDGAITLWDMETNKEAVTFQRTKNSISDKFLAFDPKWLTIAATASVEKGILLINALSGVPFLTLQHKGVERFTFSHNSKLLASASSDGTVILWDLITNGNAKMGSFSVFDTAHQDFDADEAEIFDLIFSNNNRIVTVTGSYGNTQFITFIDIHLGTLRTITNIHFDTISSDGILTASDDQLRYHMIPLLGDYDLFQIITALSVRNFGIDNLNPSLQPIYKKLPQRLINLIHHINRLPIFYSNTNQQFPSK